MDVTGRKRRSFLVTDFKHALPGAFSVKISTLDSLLQYLDCKKAGEAYSDPYSVSVSLQTQLSYRYFNKFFLCRGKKKQQQQKKKCEIISYPEYAYPYSLPQGRRLIAAVTFVSLLHRPKDTRQVYHAVKVQGHGKTPLTSQQSHIRPVSIGLHF